MSKANLTKKSPILAGVLSFFLPGLGQIYNEQMQKGVLILICFFGSMLIFIVSAAGIAIFPHTRDGFFMTTPFMTPWFYSPAQFSKLYIFFLLFVILPVLSIFAISDAVITALNINRNLAPSPQSTPAPPSPSPGTAGATMGFTASDKANNQDELRREAATKMGSEYPTGTMGSNASEAKPESPPPPPPHEAEAAGGKSGKMILGIILFAIGFFILMDQWHIEMFEWHRFWPVIPLLFGLRLIKDYKSEGNQAQLTLGLIFTGIGALCLMETWDLGRPLRWLNDFWPVLIMAMGALLALQEYKARHINK